MELEDQSWFPHWLRRHQMEFLSFTAKHLPLYDPIAPIILNLQKCCKITSWTDACSGAGGPVIRLHKKCNCSVSTLLTDVFPQPNSIQQNNIIKYHSTPINIIHDNLPQQGFVTLFNSFHHFTFEQQSAIIHQFRQEKRPFLVAELLEPNLLSLLSVMFITTVGQWLLVPFMYPFRWERLFFTYIIPIHLITVLWDGIVSVFRSPSKKHWKKLTYKLSSTDYEVTYFRRKGKLCNVSGLVGVPKIPICDQ